MNKKVQLLMKEYFSIHGEKTVNQECPIVPTRETWKVFESPERLEKKFSFPNRMQLADFLTELIRMEDQLLHHGKLTVDHKEVVVGIYTKDLNAITDRDKEYAQHVDNIFRDVQDYKYK